MIQVTYPTLHWVFEKCLARDSKKLEGKTDEREREKRDERERERERGGEEREREREREKDA